MPAVDVQAIKMLLDIYKQKNSGPGGQNHSRESKLPQCLDPKAQNPLTWGVELGSGGGGRGLFEHVPAMQP